VADAYCSALAKSFDPHSEFFSQREKEKFQEELGDQKMEFGFSVKEAKDGVVIAKLRAGSPAYKSGVINEGDRILSLQWQNMELVNVEDASVGEVNDILSGGDHGSLTINLKKSDGTSKTAILQREKAESDDDIGKVKSFILAGARKIGFISLPAFYTDWTKGREGDKGCANDVAKEIIKLKKENIDGLIIDLRFNGGGSAYEATELSGLFIDVGPVGMIRTKNEKTVTLKDVNRGTIYDGPLILMVNGYSASASEMVAGTLQDYNRALIAGSTTYGKATAQVILPLDTTINLEESLAGIRTDNYIKLTVEKLFRITGNTAQEKGVIPDIHIPDPSELSEEKEANEIAVIRSSTIQANKYYQPYPALPAGVLQSYAAALIDSIAYFSRLAKYMATQKQDQTQKNVPLQIRALLEMQMNDTTGDEEDQMGFSRPDFEVRYHAYETERMKADENLLETNERWKKLLLRDPAINVCYRLAAKMAK